MRRFPAKPFLVATTILALGLAVLGAAAACGTTGSVAHSGVSSTPGQGGGGRGASVAGAHRQATTKPRVWVSVATVTTADGSRITVAAFHGPVQYVLHDGSQDPGGLAGLVRAGSRITGPERARLLAAFNGGFMMKSLAGGYMQEGHVARPLRGGLASLVIDRAGHARIGVWGQDVPVPGQPLWTVRQNLWLLVSDGQPTAQSARWWRWGGTVGNQEYVARSALGQDAAGNLIYAAGMSTTPADLAQALSESGAWVAMELDINPEWVQLDAAAVPGGPLRAGIPGQHRPATQCLTGWTRDFIAVLAP
jgi:hypothetical protein